MVEYVEFKESKGPKIYKLGNFSFSSEEIKHLSFALVMLTLTFMFIRFSVVEKMGYMLSALVFLVIVGTSFLFHEFGHKFVAQHYGYLSEFRADFGMMFFALFLAAFVAATGFGIVFIAPGAVMIHGALSVRKNGIVSVAGPSVNLVLALLFSVLALIISPPLGSMWHDIFLLGILLNAWIGIFNMLPFWILDGKKVLAWSKPVYFSVLTGLVFFLLLAPALVM